MHVLCLRFLFGFTRYTEADLDQELHFSQQEAQMDAKEIRRGHSGQVILQTDYLFEQIETMGLGESTALRST